MQIKEMSKPVTAVPHRASAVQALNMTLIWCLQLCVYSKLINVLIHLMTVLPAVGPEPSSQALYVFAEPLHSLCCHHQTRLCPTGPCC